MTWVFFFQILYCLSNLMDWEFKCFKLDVLHVVRNTCKCLQNVLSPYYIPPPSPPSSDGLTFTENPGMDTQNKCNIQYLSTRRREISNFHPFDITSGNVWRKFLGFLTSIVPHCEIAWFEEKSTAVTWSAKKLAWISFKLSLSVGCEPLSYVHIYHCREIFSVRRSDENELGRRFLLARIARRVQHRLPPERRNVNLPSSRLIICSLHLRVMR